MAWIGFPRIYAKTLTLLVWIGLSLAGTLAWADDRLERDIAPFREIYLKATEGDKVSLRLALSMLRDLEGKYPHHPLILTYKGGALSLRGIDIGKRPLDRMRETEEGLNLIDHSLRRLTGTAGQTLAAAEARLVAAYVFIHLPDGIFHRLKEGGRLVDQLLKDDLFIQMPAAMRAAIYFAAATAAAKQNDPTQYKKYLELTVQTDPEGKNGKEALALLKTIPG